MHDAEVCAELLLHRLETFARSKVWGQTSIGSIRERQSSLIPAAVSIVGNFAANRPRQWAQRKRHPALNALSTSGRGVSFAPTGNGNQ